MAILILFLYSDVLILCLLLAMYSIFRRHTWALLAFVYTLSATLPIVSAEMDVIADSTDYISISPVIQLISYNDIYGKYPEMLGWGSASVINDSGIIISNNHVVDNGKGQTATAFNVCITQKIKEKPKCDYTATLIGRDESLDISMLRINPLDIFGNRVDYARLRTVDIDYDYIPTQKDESYIVGYPWIGADTITETKGIVSGTSEYNGHRYIKTDTLIAGGNSGGAMLSASGRLIGIPTFTIGGGWSFDSSLGYALSISEAKDFITENLTKAPSVPEQVYGTDFPLYQKKLKTVESINDKRSVSDKLLTLSFGDTYEVKNYIENRYLELGIRQNKDIAVSGLTIEMIETPKLSNKGRLFYLAQMLGIYSKSYQKLVTKTIGGLTFYRPVSKTDVTGGNTDYTQIFFAQITDTKIVVINLSASLYDEKNSKKIQTEIDNVLSKITFSTDTTSLNTLSFDFSLVAPKLAIRDTSRMSLQNDRVGTYVRFLGNLHEYFTLWVSESGLYTGKGKGIDDIYTAETDSVANGYKSKVSLAWHPGYITCDSISSSSSYYGGYYGYNSQSVSSIGEDENGLPIDDARTCTMKFYNFTGTNDRDYYITLSIFATKGTIQKQLDAVNTILTNDLSIDTYGDSTTKLVNIYDSLISLRFRDLGYQSEGYKEKLRTLVKYGFLKNSLSFQPYKPLTWGDFLIMDTKMIYDFDTVRHAKGKCAATDATCLFSHYAVTVGSGSTTLDAIFSSMGVDYDHYVDSSLVSRFTDILRLRLAGVTDIRSELDLARYQNTPIDEPKYADDYKKAQAFDASIYGNKRFTLYDIGVSSDYFRSEKTINYASGYGIWEIPIYHTAPFDFSIGFGNTSTGYLLPYEVRDREFATWSDNNIKFRNTCADKDNDTEYIACSRAADLRDREYSDAYAKVPSMSKYGYGMTTVLTKAEAIDMLASQIDFGLFDAELAKKKDTMVSAQ